MTANTQYIAFPPTFFAFVCRFVTGPFHIALCHFLFGSLCGGWCVFAIVTTFCFVNLISFSLLLHFLLYLHKYSSYASTRLNRIYTIFYYVFFGIFLVYKITRIHTFWLLPVQVLHFAYIYFVAFDAICICDGLYHAMKCRFSHAVLVIKRRKANYVHTP